MTRKRLNSILLAAAFAAMFVAPAETWAKKPGGGGGGGGTSAAYTIIPFMPPGSTSTSSWLNDLNDQGQAVGMLQYAPGPFEAIHLDLASGAYTTLQNTALSGGSGAEGVNNLNQIVGANEISGLFWASPNAIPIELPPLIGDLTSIAPRINDNGIIVGASRSGSEGFTVGVVWRVSFDQDGIPQVDGPIELPPLLAGDVWVRGADINQVEAGAAQVLGRSGSESQAVIWTIALNPDGTIAIPDVPMPVGTLGLSNPSWSSGAGINNLGDVCGYSDYLPFVALADQQPQSLSVPRGTFYSWASDINDGGEIVGTAELPYPGSKRPPGVYYAYRWKDGQRIDLTSKIASGSGWDHLSEATVINNYGLIGGSGRFDVPYRGFILIPNAQ